MQSNFPDFEAFNTYVKNKEKDALLITCRPCEEYDVFYA